MYSRGLFLRRETGVLQVWLWVGGGAHQRNEVVGAPTAKAQSQRKWKALSSVAIALGCARPPFNGGGYISV